MRKLGFIVSAASVLGGASPTLAGAFFIPQQSTSGIGRAFAGGAAAAGDSSTIFSNPAGMTELGGAEALAGVHLIFPDIQLRNAGSTAATPGTGLASVPSTGDVGKEPTDPTPVPNLYAAMPLMDGRLWVGLGITAPFGLGLEYDENAFNRYDTLSIKLITVDVAPSVAYRVTDWLSVGGGLDIQYAKAKLTQAVPNPLTPGGPTAATDGLSTVRGDDYSVGGNFGVLLKPLESTRVGLHWRSRMTHTLKGTAALERLTGPLAAFNGDPDVKVDLKLPDIVSFGVAHRLTPQLTLFGGVDYFNWSRFDELRFKFGNGAADAVRTENYRDTYAVSVGADYALTERLTLRGGFMYDQTPTVDRFRATSVPDANRYWTNVGASYRFADGWTVDFAYSHVFFEDTRVDVTRDFFAGTLVASSARVRANVETQVDTVSVALRHRF